MIWKNCSKSLAHGLTDYLFYDVISIVFRWMDGCSLSISISQVKIFRKWIERITKQLGSFGGEIKMNGRCAKLMKAI